MSVSLFGFSVCPVKSTSSSLSLHSSYSSSYPFNSPLIVSVCNLNRIEFLRGFLPWLCLSWQLHISHLAVVKTFPELICHPQYTTTVQSYRLIACTYTCMHLCKINVRCLINTNRKLGNPHSYDLSVLKVNTLPTKIYDVKYGAVKMSSLIYFKPEKHWV